MAKQLLSFLIALVMSLPTLASSEYCNELNVKEAIKVKNAANESETNVLQSYTLLRNGTLFWDVFVNLNFKADKKYQRENPGIDPKNVSKIFTKFVTKCFDRYSHKLTDELGRHIRLRLYDKSSLIDIPAPEKLMVIVSDKNARATPIFYNSDIQCETIVHETFHLLGLADEYEELYKSLNPNLFLRLFRPYVSYNPKGEAFDCRSKSPDHSIMHFQRFLNSEKQVLFSGQLNAILYPNCQDRNEDYYHCISKAYLTSKEHGSLVGCGETYDICKTYDWLYSKRP
jgi:hypothetical protein